jgi:hypothetical protein
MEPNSSLFATKHDIQMNLISRNMDFHHIFKILEIMLLITITMMLRTMLKTINQLLMDSLGRPLLITAILLLLLTNDNVVNRGLQKTTVHSKSTTQQCYREL